MKMSSKKVMIAGSGDALGQSVADHFFNLGADVAYLSDTAKPDEKKEGGNLFMSCSFKNKSSNECRRMVAEAIENLDGLDFLVCLSEATKSTRMMEVTEDHWDDVIGFTLKPVLFTIQACLAALRESRGSIVIVSGVNGLIAGDSDNFVRSIANGGLVGLVRTLSLELAADNIRVNAVCPGHIERSSFEQASAAGKENTDDRLNEVIPLGRKSSLEELVSSVEYLALDGASYCTGSVFVNDGGCLANASMAAHQ